MMALGSVMLPLGQRVYTSAMDALWPVQPVPPRFASVVVGSIDSVTASTSGTWWPLAIVTVFAMGLLLSLGRMAVGLHALWQVWREASEIDVPDDIRVLQQEMRVSRVRFLASPRVSGPATFGFRHHVILLPPPVLQVPELRRQVACHELWHVKRADWPVAMASQLIQAFFWYHPAAWWLADRVELLRERSVDEAVVEQLRDRDAYVEALVASAGAHIGLPSALATGWTRKRHLTDRVNALLRSPGPRTNPGAEFMKQLFVTIVVARLATSSLVAFPTAQQPDVYTIGGEVSAPKVVRMVRPEYTKEALRQRIAGEVVLSAIVKADGSVGDVAVKQSLDDRYGLDDAAIAAVKQCVFSPGTRQGRPVAVRVDVSMKFTLK
jgi:TonB family protein